MHSTRPCEVRALGFLVFVVWSARAHIPLPPRGCPSALPSACRPGQGPWPRAGQRPRQAAGSPPTPPHSDGPQGTAAVQFWGRKRQGNKAHERAQQTNTSFGCDTANMHAGHGWVHQQNKEDGRARHEERSATPMRGADILAHAANSFSTSTTSSPTHTECRGWRWRCRRSPLRCPRSPRPRGECGQCCPHAGATGALVRHCKDSTPRGTIR